jgi:uncharacterized protein YgbK (DUF1537 family)
VEACDPISMLESCDTDTHATPIAMQPIARVSSMTRALNLRAVASRLDDAMDRNGAAVVHTALGPDDPSLVRVRERLAAKSISPERVAAAIGSGFARLVREVLERGPVRRLVVCGGDSSSYTMRALGAWALEVVASSFADNAHVCRLLADDPAIHGIEVLLKGGQVGRPDVLLRMRDGFGIR